MSRDLPGKREPAACDMKISLTCALEAIAAGRAAFRVAIFAGITARHLVEVTMKERIQTLCNDYSMLMSTHIASSRNRSSFLLHD